MNSVIKDTDGKQHHVLLVDDDKKVLDALRRALMKLPCNLDATTDPLVALESARHQQYDLVISDYRMPELDGVTLLSYIRQIQPESLRMVLSGHTDANVLLAAINQAHIHRYLQKPWDDEELRFAVSKALESLDKKPSAA